MSEFSSVAGLALSPKVKPALAPVGLKEQYYHLTADRILFPAKAHLSRDGFFALDYFFRYKLCLPSYRENRDEALIILQAKLRFIPIPHWSRFLKMSVELAALAADLDHSLIMIMHSMQLDAKVVSVAELEQAIAIENRLEERRRMFEYLIEMVRLAEIISARGFPNSLMVLVKKTVKMLGAEDLNLHIDALLELGDKLRGQPLKKALDAIEDTEKDYMATAFFDQC